MAAQVLWVDLEVQVDQQHLEGIQTQPDLEEAVAVQQPEVAHQLRAEGPEALV
ncbi:hypothetical protein RS417_003029 [Enterobacter roggenkampii]|nr:hypothetical protein [Enterobacter roggenkampii]